MSSMMKYSRQNPSPRYTAMLNLYRTLHADGERARGFSPEETYPGISLLPNLARVKALIEATGATSILDYGCGKGVAYELSPLNVSGVGRIESVLDYWDVDTVHCYDPCYVPYSKLPEEQFDGVIASDVLEHCPEEDIDWIVRELFGFARRFVFASVSCVPAKTHLPDGQNAHITLFPGPWWRDRFAAAAGDSGIEWLVLSLEQLQQPGPPQYVQNEYASR